MNVRVLFRSVVYANLRFFRCLLSFLCGLLNVLFFLISLLQIVSPTIRAKPGQNSNNPIHSPPACFVTAASCERASSRHPPRGPALAALAIADRSRGRSEVRRVRTHVTVIGYLRSRRERDGTVSVEGRDVHEPGPTAGYPPRDGFCLWLEACIGL